MGVMIEHFAGVFPLWLAPRQAIVVPVSNKFDDYGREVLAQLREVGVRAEIDDSTDGLNKKVRNAEKAHINYILVVGEEEENNKTVAVRNYKTKEQDGQKVDDFVTAITNEISEKRL